MAVSVDVKGDDQVEVELVTTALQYGLKECGFNNVELTCPDNLAIADPSSDTPSTMAALRGENPAAFDVVIDIEASVIQDLVEGDDDLPKPGDDDVVEED